MTLLGDVVICPEVAYENAKESDTRFQEELDLLIEEWTRSQEPREAMEKLQEAGVPAGPSFHSGDVLNDPHLKKRGMIVDTDHPEVGRYPMLGVPWKTTPALDVTYEPAPLIGQHNDYVLRELLGLSQAQVDRLVQEGAIM